MKRFRPETLFSLTFQVDLPDGKSLRRERVVSQRQSKTPPHVDQCFSERVDQCIIVIGRRRDAQPLCAARDGRIVDRLDIDAVLGEQEIARFLALLRITHSQCASH